MRPKLKLKFNGQIVTKYYHENAEIEHEKSLKLWEISQRSGFEFPQPLRLDRDAGSIEFARIPRRRSIRTDYLLYMKEKNPEEELILVFRRAGEILGIIHRDLTLSETVDWRPTAEFSEAAQAAGCTDVAHLCGQLPTVILHGDYGVENIERDIESSSLKLAVFDASPNYFVTFAPHAVGPIYVDVGNFLSVLFGLVPLRHHPMMNWKRVAKLQTTFIDGYHQTAGFKCDIQTARLFGYATASCYLKRNFKNPLLHYFAMWLLFNPLKKLEIS